MKPAFLLLDGRLHRSDEALISPDNRSFRYGDGLFETMKVVDGRILLEALHMERLFRSMELLRFDLPAAFTPAQLRSQVLAITEKNGVSPLARVRVTVFAGEQGLHETVRRAPHCLVQAWDAGSAANTFNENGLEIGIYTEGHKSCDVFAQLKNNNYLTYIMASLWAQERKLNDAIVLNAYGRVADATIANVFIVKDGRIKTPALSEGCVNGVMRRHLLHSLRKAGMPVEETRLLPEEVMEASEVFLTNAIKGIRWVKQVGESGFGNDISTLLYQQFVQPLFLV